MPTPRALRGWWWLPSRIALLLGAGALSAVGAKADTTEPQADKTLSRVPLQSAKTFGELLVWSDGGRIYVAEAGRPAQELQLEDTAEAQRLRQLLERDGASPGTPHSVPHRMILAGDGGAGFHRSSGSTNPPDNGGAGNGTQGASNGSRQQQSDTPADRHPGDRAKHG